MELERVIIKEIEYPKVMNKELIERWAEGIPIFSENDPTRPEWRETPTFPVDLNSEGYGLVSVKNEADRESNPTQTIKDRMAWELTTLFRDYARGAYLREKREGADTNSLVVPRLSYITAGNVGKAVSNMFRKYGLPPMKLLVGISIQPERLEALKRLHADIYMAELDQNVFKKEAEKKKRPYTPEEIKRLTNNERGIDITSVMIIEPQAVFYDWHVHEAFNEEAEAIYIPYGSGRLMENYLVWQMRNARRRDPRLKIPLSSLLKMSILGAEPEERESAADKLTGDYNPFVLFNEQDILALKSLGFTGKETGIYKLREEKVKRAYQILSRYCETEPSGSAGLALYLQRFEEGKVNPREKVLVVNTGKGI